MTAFASIVLAALPGLGAKSGADGAAPADGQAAAGRGGGLFDTMMAAVTAVSPARPEAGATVATALANPAADILGAGLRVVAGETSDEALSSRTPEQALELIPAVTDSETAEGSDAAEALAAAGTVLVAPTPAAATAATPEGERTAAAPSPASAVAGPAPVSFDDAAPAPAPAVAADLPTPATPATAGQASAAPATPPVAGPPTAPGVTEAVTRLVGRVLDNAPKTEAEVAPPVEASADAVVDTPLELALDTALSPEAPVPVEAAVVEAPVAPAPAVSRRPARAEADRSGAAITAEAEPDARTVRPADRTDTPTVAQAAPLTRPEPALTSGLMTDPGAEPEGEAATLDAATAAPTLQAAAETPAEAAPTRGSPETVARLASDIARKLEGRSTRFDVQLDPLGLGKVDVSIEINADGRLSASLSFDSAQTAADLRGRAGELREALEKAGFDLTDGGLSFDMNNPGGSGGRETRESLAAWSSRAFQSARTGLEQADALAARSIWSRTPSGGVDIRI